MRKIFLVFALIFIFLNLFVVSAQDTDLIESSDLNESVISESPAVSIETQVSENSIYIGNQTEVSVTLRNVGVSNNSLIKIRFKLHTKFFLTHQ